MWKIILIIISGLIYLPSLFYGFSQDDFIHLSASQTNTFLGFLNFFNPFAYFPEIFFYRPLSTQVYFFFNHLVFGLNPLPFHIEALILHLTNAWLFYLLVKKVFQNERVAFLSGLLYSASAVHFLSLYYISAFQEVAKVFFVLLSVILFFNFQQTKKNYWLAMSSLSFIASLLVKETAVVLPLLLLSLDIIKHRLDWKNAIKRQWKVYLIFVVILIVYFVVRLEGFQTLFHQGEYATALSFGEIIQNLKWYVLWTFGLPEIISSYPSLKPSSLIQLGKDLPFGSVILIDFGLVFVSIFCLIFINRKYLSLKAVWLALLFLIPLIPVLLLHGHNYPQYLDLSLLGVLPPISYLCLKTRLKVIPIAFLVTFLSLQVLSLRLSELTHWTTHRSQVANYYYTDLSNKLGQYSEPYEVIFTGPEAKLKEISVALAGQDALKLWFPGKVGQVKYEVTPQINKPSLVEEVTRF